MYLQRSTKVIFLIIIAVNKNCRKIIKKNGKYWDSNPYLVLQNPIVLPTVPWESSEFLKNVSEIIEIYGPTEIRTRTYCLRNFCPHRTAETIYSKI